MLKDQGNLQLYALTPFHYKFQEVVDRHGVYEEEVKNAKNLIGDIRSGGDS